MLQRAKWEKHHDVTKDLEMQPCDGNSMAGPLQYWAMQQPIVGFCAWSGQSCPVVVEGSVVHAGVLCQRSGRVQAIARIYGDGNNDGAAKNKSLKSVSFLNGFVL
jgi:hypothetical protein